MGSDLNVRLASMPPPPRLLQTPDVHHEASRVGEICRQEARADPVSLVAGKVLVVEHFFDVLCELCEVDNGVGTPRPVPFLLRVFFLDVEELHGDRGLCFPQGIGLGD